MAAAVSFGLSVPAVVMHVPGLSDLHHWPSALQIWSLHQHPSDTGCALHTVHSTLVLVPLVNRGRQDSSYCASLRLPLLHLGRRGSNNHSLSQGLRCVPACCLCVCSGCSDDVGAHTWHDGRLCTQPHAMKAAPRQQPCWQFAPPNRHEQRPAQSLGSCVCVAIVARQALHGSGTRVFSTEAALSRCACKVFSSRTGHSPHASLLCTT